MDLKSVSMASMKLIEYLAATDLKIDEKIVVCKSVGDMLQRVMFMEVELINMRTMMENFSDREK